MEMSRDEAMSLIGSRSWYHSFEVLPGLVTPGQHWIDAARIFDEHFNLPRQLHGKRALDIGAADGPYSFELEARGAMVTALDIQKPETVGFNAAKVVRRSAAEYVQGSVYELDRLFTEPFDIITFFGVWYHLKHPLMAFERISRALKPDGLLMFSGECLLNHAEHEQHDPEALSKIAQELARSDLAICVFYAGRYKDSEYNWFIPNPSCVRAWLEASDSK